MEFILKFGLLSGFGAELFEFKAFGGYMLPTRVAGGNHIGTKDYFPFYEVSVSDVHFPTIKEGK